MTHFPFLHRTLYPVLACGLLIVLAGCQTAVTPNVPPPSGSDQHITQQPIPAIPEVTPGVGTAFPTPSTLPASTPTNQLQHTHYLLQADYDTTNRRLAVRETVDYSNLTKVTLLSLPLIVEPNLHDGVFTLQGITSSDIKPVPYRLSGAQLWLDLASPLQPGEQLEPFTITYSLEIPLGSGVLAANARQANFGDWYPFVPYASGGRQWALDSPGSVGEHLTYPEADFDVELRVLPAENSLVLAASAVGLKDGGGYHFHIQSARNFTWSLGSAYVHLQDKAGNIQVDEYVFPEHEKAGKASLQATVQALNLYSRLFGPYPHKSLTAVECTFPDGMEYDGLYFLGQEYYATYTGDARDYLTALSAHETAHQWWGGLVGNNPARDPWLDEALATYSERIFYENKYPDLLDWWWQYRVDRFHPSGKVNSSIADFSAFRPYVDAVYLRGARFLEDLRHQVGDETFFAILKTYAGQYAHAQATPDDFLSLVRSKSDANIDALLSEYFTP